VMAVAISGADNEQQIEENTAAASAPLSAEDLQQLTEASAGLSISLDGPQYG
jgi:aryl-alcohol dehydrogenase-like predicted oxidoreductase